MDSKKIKATRWARREASVIAGVLKISQIAVLTKVRDSLTKDSLIRQRDVAAVFGGNGTNEGDRP